MWELLKPFSVFPNEALACPPPGQPSNTKGRTRVLRPVVPRLCRVCFLERVGPQGRCGTPKEPNPGGLMRRRIGVAESQEQRMK